MILKNEKALQAFAEKMMEAKSRLEELHTHLNDHMGISKDDINWTHVGLVGYIAEQLTQLTDRAFERGEYAE